MAEGSKRKRAGSRRRRNSALMAWLRLVRLPSLPTVPGDPIAGFFLAAGPDLVLDIRLLKAVGVSLCYFIAGLLINDLVDTSEDKIDRPWRPLASRAIPRSAVKLVALLFLAGGSYLVAVAEPRTRITGFCLLLAVLTFDFFSKRVPGLGALNMAFCRGLSLLLGASFVATDDQLPVPVLLGALTVGLYVFSVSLVARDETQPEKILSIRNVPLYGSLLALPLPAVIAYAAGPLSMVVAVLLYIPAVVVAFRCAWSIGRSTHSMSRFHCSRKDHVERMARNVGWLIGSLMFLQAALVVASETPDIKYVYAAALVVAWLPITLLGRRFYSH